jgi:hypothetical protein
MPRACPVEIHVRRYTDFAQPAKLDATGQAPWHLSDCCAKLGHGIHRG